MNVVPPTSPARARGLAMHVSRVGFVGGAERVCLAIVEATSAHGWRSAVACPDGTLAAEAVAKGAEVVRIPIDRTQITFDPRRLVGYAKTFVAGRRHIIDEARRLGVSLIHVHHPVGAVYAAEAKRRLGVPRVLHVHDILPARPLYALAMRRAVAVADVVVACSEAGRDLAVACGARRGDVLVVHNGLAPGFAEAAAATAPVALGVAGRHLGVFAAIEPRKGQAVAVAAFARLLVSHPDLHLWLVGGETEGAGGGYADEIRRMAADPATGGRVRLLGFRSDVAALMKAMDVVALPSVAMESLPMSLIEAMSLGRPCVASRIGGTSEIVDDGKTGRLVPPGDAGALAAAVTDLLGPYGAAVGAAAAVAAAARFSGEAFGRRMAAVYDGLVPEGATAPGFRPAAA